MIENIEQFIRFIPTARGTHFEDIEPFILEGLSWSQTEIFGKNLTDAIHAGNDDEATRMLNSIVALKAYSVAIPFLDVVQTSNGFAVVNNSNQAPASRERVDKLLGWVNDRLYYHADSLIEYVSEKANLMTEWRKFHRFEYLTELLFCTGIEFANYSGNYEAYYKYKRGIPFVDLHKFHAIIKGIQENQIAAYISRDYLAELIDKNRLKTTSVVETTMLNRLRFILGLFLQKEDVKAIELLKEIVNEMMRALDQFPAFAHSEEYRLKVAARYENKQQDPTYFFG